MEVLKVARDGAQTTRLTARGAIAVTATHGARGHPCLAAKHTEQVARQAAAHHALLCAEHLISCAMHRPDLCEQIAVTLPNATTARDLSPSRPARKSAHRNVASNNLRRLQSINSQEVRVSLRVEGDRAPERLQIAADEAARSGDLRTYGPTADHDRVRERRQTHDAAVGRVPRLGSRRLREREGEGSGGGVFTLFFFTAAVWCVPFSVPLVYSINYKRKKTNVKNHGLANP